MDPISNVDRLVLLLRQRLQQRERREAGRTSSVRTGTGADALGAARSIAAITEVDDRQLRRTLLQGLLADYFGRALLNEARFQQLVDQVLDAIEGDAEASRLLDEVSDALRRAAR